MQQFCLPGILQKCLWMCMKDVQNVGSSTICNGPKLEAIQMSLNRLGNYELPLKWNILQQ